MIGLVYFYREWTAPHGQHQQLNYFLMVAYFLKMALYAYHIIAQAFIPPSLQMNGWHFAFFVNRIFEFQLLCVIVYSLARMYARADTDRWRRKSHALVAAVDNLPNRSARKTRRDNNE